MMPSKNKTRPHIKPAKRPARATRRAAEPAKRTKSVKGTKPVKRTKSVKPTRSVKSRKPDARTKRATPAKPTERATGASPGSRALPANAVREKAPPRSEEPSADSLFKAAHAALDTDDLDAAIELFTQAMELAPGNAALIFSRGAVHAKKGDPRHAIADFERAIEVNPGYADAHLNCGLCHVALGEHIPAVTHFTRAIQFGLGQDATCVQAHYHRAGSLEALGEIRAAIDDLNQVVTLIPETPTADLSAKRASALLARVSPG